MGDNFKKRSIATSCLALFLTLATGCQTTTPAADAGSGQLTTDRQTPETTTIDGQPFATTSTSHKATALVFLLPDCPIANGYAPEIARLNAEYKDQGIRFVLVYAERDIDTGKARKHRSEYRHECEAVIDPDLSLALRTGATVTPEAVLLSPKGSVLYRGRIDDRFPAYGKRRATPTKTELRDALDAVLAGRPIAVTRSQAIGCFLDLP